MLTPPTDLSADDVCTAARELWDVDADEATHLPVGFGAQHWRVGPLFVTVDTLEPHHSAASLEAAYRGAAALAGEGGLEVVVAPLPTVTGRFTAPLGAGMVSATPWVDGRRPSDPDGGLDLVARLHAVHPPAGLPRWRPLVPASYADSLGERLRVPWTRGPHAATAHRALAAHRTQVDGWVVDYHRLADVARRRAWVPTHGEPGAQNQLVTADGLRLVDWESLRLAPVERDLRSFPEAHNGCDPDMLALFDLEWRLDEVAQYATWFEAPHGDSEDDRTALTGLLEELERP